jgi:hypothetical protein
VGVKHRVVFGTQWAIEQVLATCGWTINTSFVERLNLDLRQRVAAIGRRVNTLCQGEAGLRDQLSLFQVYHNFVLPHASLRQPLLMPEVPNDNGSASGHPSASPRGSHEHYPQGSGTRPWGVVYRQPAANSCYLKTGYNALISPPV